MPIEIGISATIGGIAGNTPGGGTPSFSNTKSILLDGMDALVSFSQVTYTGEFTTSFWIKPDALGSSFLTGREANSDYVWLRTVAQIRIRINFSTYIFSEGGGNNINTGAWNHLLISRDSSNNVSLFLNGASFSTSQVCAGDHRLDQIGKVDANYYDGNVDETAFWDSDQSSNLATIYNSGVPNDISSLSPTLWYRMGDGDTAPTLTDNGSSGNDGTMVFFNTFSTDVPPNPFVNTKSILLDGMDDFVTMGDTLDFERTESFSLSAWIKRGSTGVNDTIVSKMESSGSYRGYFLYITSSNKIRFILRNVNTTSNRLFVDSTSSITSGNWNHILVTYNGSSSGSGVKIYINGVSDTVTTSGTLSATILNSSPFNIGARNSNSLFANATIDEVSVFNSELSSSDATAIYNSGTPTDLSSYSPLSWWRCGDNDTSPTLTDNGSGGNDGTMVFFNTFSTDVPT